MFFTSYHDKVNPPQPVTNLSISTDGWYNAYVEISDNDSTYSKAAHVLVKKGEIDQICFSRTDCLSNFDFTTKYEYSENVSYRKGNQNTYTVYLIPKEWDQAQEQQRPSKESE